MKSLTIIQPITIKAKVTLHLKEKLIRDIRAALQKLEAELQRLEFTGKRLIAEWEKQKPDQVVVIKRQLEGEKQKRMEARNQLLQKLKEVQEMEIGQEIKQGTVNRLVEVQIGDYWEKISGVEIVLEDNKIIDIRYPDAIGEGCHDG
ncbi:YlqD family protein [Calderihabitans maritimus]|uniref:YlqD protein n=1 Tax=Calderihabitans maritimus TaxID=1246530 RepID=A0A1Z5HU27_9FIRM|nr:YlqD family protein [Calderihabitans maritimus]GAW92825.1 hypothetical protein KKC1_19740 [Calderihabitans maritimus]